MASEKKDKQIHVKVTNSELLEIADLARAAGKSTAQYMRELALSGTKCTRCHGTGLDPKAGRR